MSYDLPTLPRALFEIFHSQEKIKEDFGRKSLKAQIIEDEVPDLLKQKHAYSQSSVHSSSSKAVFRG